MLYKMKKYVPIFKRIYINPYCALVLSTVLNPVKETNLVSFYISLVKDRIQQVLYSSSTYEMMDYNKYASIDIDV